MARISVPVPVKMALGINSDDPNAVVMAAFKAPFFAPMAQIHRRVVQRTGISEIEIDADPLKNGQQRAIVKMGAPPSTMPGELAVKVAAMMIVKGKGNLYIDEARRVALGMPVGSTRSLDDGSSDDEVIDDASYSLLAPASSGLRASFDPFVTPVVLVAILGVVGVALPLVLPMVLEWGKGAVNLVSKTVTGKELLPNEKARPKSKPAPSAPKSLIPGVPDVALYAAGGVALVAIVMKKA